MQREPPQGELLVSNQYNARVQELAHSLNITLLDLPAYSPNLNLLERVWRLVKAKCLRNRCYEEFDTIRSAIDSFLVSLRGKNKPLLRSLVTERFHLYTHQNS